MAVCGATRTLDFDVACFARFGLAARRIRHARVRYFATRFVTRARTAYFAHAGLHTTHAHAALNRRARTHAREDTRRLRAVVRGGGHGRRARVAFTRSCPHRTALRLQRCGGRRRRGYILLPYLYYYDVNINQILYSI